ncbi:MULTISPECIES: hypothetical protein [unclassified Pseudomonas]|uniref:hypothetical protein n=1 Tax=unclassified Pseudomonas TaxID=196821 RepID=UPI000BD2979A|nr:MULTISPECIES: hypothetical protein [unclassified Pseudomonas]PVZ15761.1 hypothetical protein F474_02540 [Pseudomonas sp. URIL14HWK12:I12]PVZ25135.1 hypothetical protein F470_02195 [Pseudomonas sp. URIL14HWK12:I10]PVZ34981.1 hypothetical protein F472_02541 [Pseudomonas sp. URIL14HWK12:I11]SNZ09826.1 hypothetical protein SAMN05660463_01528 [Pseudomonas sp. URIL14HWK12:I9]
MHSSNTPNDAGLIWRADLTLQPDTGAASIRRQNAIDQVQRNRPGTARIEREIMIAVIVLYTLILGSFAALHLYGSHVLPDKPEATAEQVAP